MKRFMPGFFQNDKFCGYFYTENSDCNPSHDWNDILFGLRVERSGTRNQKDIMESGIKLQIKKWSIMKIKNSLLTIH